MWHGSGAATMSVIRRGLPVGALLAAAGCASVSPAPVFQDVAKQVRALSGQQLRWEVAGDDARAIETEISRLYSGELSVDAAVQIALLANPWLQGRFEELAIGQSDLVQAGLLSNPSVSLGGLAWEADRLAPNLFASVEQHFLDLLTMPMRKRIAATELEAVKLRVGDEVLGLAAEVRAAYYGAQAGAQVAAMRRLVSAGSSAAAALAERQHAAGNLSDLGLNTELALAAQTGLDQTRSEGEAAMLREKLARLMGAWGPRTAFRLPARLPELPTDAAVAEHLESRAIQQRLDVRAARRSVQAMDDVLTLAKTTRWTGTVSVSLESGRLRDSGRFAFGPSLALTVPLFDQRQAQIAKLEAFRRQGQADLQSVAIAVRSEVRGAHARMVTARRVVETYVGTIIPLRENIVRFSQQHYDAMLLGVYQLIVAKQGEYDAYRASIEALRDYWLARSDLERAIGGRLATVPATSSTGTP